MQYVLPIVGFFLGAVIAYLYAERRSRAAVGDARSALAAAGHRVRAASRRQTAIANRDNIEWVELPDLENEVDWARLLDGMDIVVHLAAIAHRSHADSGDYARANRVATASLAQAAHSRWKYLLKLCRKPKMASSVS